MSAVLVALAHRADDKTWECFPGQNTLASMTGMSRATVLRALAKLDMAGIIRRERRRRADGSRSSDKCILNRSYVAPGNVAQSNVAPSNVAGSLDLGLTVQSPTLQGATAIDQSGDQEEDHPALARSSSKKEKTAAVRGSRVPRDFVITAELREWAKIETPLVNVDAKLAEFIDYWAAVPGDKGVKLDWVSTWRNGMRKQQEWAKRDGIASDVTSTRRVVSGRKPGLTHCHRHPNVSIDEFNPCGVCKREEQSNA